MTLIAATLNYSYPVILGDLLVTSPEKSNDFKLPTFLKGVEKYLPENISDYPAKLVQKIYLIKDNLVVAIAGNFIENRDFIKAIIAYYELKKCTEENIKEFISEYDQTKFVNSAYLILYYEKKESGFLMCPIIIGKSWKTGDSKLFEKIYAIGSGSSDFITETNRYSNVEVYGSINDSNRALSVNMMLLSGLLAKESFTLETIKKYWGAGFELITFDNIKEKYYKVDEFTYIIWKGTLNLNSEELDIFPYLVLSYKYIDDVLIIFSSIENKYEGFAILPIYIDKKDVDKSDFPKEFKVYDKNICNTFILELSNGTVATPSVLINKKDNVPDSIIINVSNETGLEIRISDEITKKLIKDLIRIDKNNT